MGRGGSQAQRVAKGKKMHGHYGHETVTSQNLNVLLVNQQENLIVISGAIPGPAGSLVTIKSSNKHPTDKIKVDLISQKNQDAILAANEKLQDKDALFEANEKVEEPKDATGGEKK
jgi:large subunit ribosomal protein L3